MLEKRMQGQSQMEADDRKEEDLSKVFLISVV